MGIEVIKFKRFSKNTLQGFVDLKLTKIGLEIRGCTYHVKNGKKWIGLPARQYEDENGKAAWSNTLQFDDAHHAGFQKKAIEALDRYLEKNRAEGGPTNGESIGT